MENFGMGRGVAYLKEVLLQGISILIHTVTNLLFFRFVCLFLKFPAMERVDFLFTSCSWLALLRDSAVFQPL